MPRGKKITPVIKRKSTTTRKPRTCATKRTCRTTRKRTGAVARRKMVEINDIPEELVPKENKWWRALKILFGIGAVGGAAALGYIGYKNKDNIEKTAKEMMKVAGDKSKQSLEDAKKFLNKNWDAAKEMANNAYDSSKKFANNAYDTSKKYVNNAYDTSKKYAFDTWAKGKAAGKAISDKIGDKYWGARLRFDELKEEANEKGISQMASDYFAERNRKKTYDVPIKKINLRSKRFNDVANSINFPDNNLAPLAITDGSEKRRTITDPIYSGLLNSPRNNDGPNYSRYIIRELHDIKDRLKTTNRVSWRDLADTLDEYRRQLKNINPFSDNVVDNNINDAIDYAQRIEATNDINTIETYKDKLERCIDTLDNKYYSIIRN